MQLFLNRFLTFFTSIALLLITSCVTIPSSCYFCNEPSARLSFVKIAGITSDSHAYTGSGVVVDHISDLHSIILTAGHICKENAQLMVVLDYKENDYGVLKMYLSNNDDLCAIVTATKINVTPSRISTKPLVISDKVFNISAPMGIHGPDMSLMFSGYYSGIMSIREEKYVLNVFTVPGYGGSSGSPIFNEDWEIVSIVSRGLPNFTHFMIGVSHGRVLQFVTQINKNYINNNLYPIISESKERVCPMTHSCKI